MQGVKRAIECAKAGRKYNALITETFDLAEKQCAEHLKRNIKPFTLVVKDNFAVEGVPMTCASGMLANYTAPYTATVVQRLVEKGACVIGKANLDEFAMGSANINSYYGPARNPKTPDSQLDGDFYVAGGSSGGSAVAVTENMADVALGSDTGGSARNPGSFNGIVALKPSYGLISRYGLVPLANSFDSTSFFTRNVEDCIRFLEYALGRDPQDCTNLDSPPPHEDDNLSIKDVPRLRIGLPKEFTKTSVSGECKELWQQAINLLESLGAKMIVVSLPHTRYTDACYHILNKSDVQSNMARFDSLRFGHHANKSASFAQQLVDSRQTALSYVIRQRIIAGNYFNLEENKGKYFHQAAKIRRLIQMDFENAFRDQTLDAILIPSMRHSAPTIGQVKTQTLVEGRNEDFFTQSANMCGLPAISVPFGKCSNNMPIGMQFIGPYLSDRKCLALGKILQDLVSSNESK
jgi:aspartyl-tRNA(Asn)/glutamyl-tRNA(Gln) amidotransferase subunit A